MNACIDCKHASCSHNPYCYHPDNGYDIVVGGPRTISCSVARSGWSRSSDCGPEGRRFEPRENVPETPPAWARFVERFLSILNALRSPKP